MAIHWRSKVLVAKIESGYGNDSLPTGANGILAVDIKLSPIEGEDVSRELDLPFIGAEATIPANLHRKIAFKVEAVPSGTAGTSPPWAVLLRACGVAQVTTPGTSVVFNPISTGFQSVSIYFQLGGTLYRMPGARGTVTFMVTAQGIPYLEFEFTGLYVGPTEETVIAPTLTAFQKPQVASVANTPEFTLNAEVMVMRSFSLKLGNTVEPRFLVNSEEVIISDRDDMVEMVVEAKPVTLINPYALAIAQTQVPLMLRHGTGVGRRTALSIPGLLLMRPNDLSENQGIVEWPLKGRAIGTDGTDQWTLTLT
jgi:hypothetical protein